ncbi:MAG: trigger factor [Erysipelotrichaceae bacterium]|nr:trigger factor [Erysipelotrichaceae bacterium]MDD3809625.1 trigger factor [Erysipelotrichaceae bacterium]
MNTSIKRLENAITEVKLSFDKEEWTGAKEAAVDKLAKNVKVDGFRQGKAPKQLVRSKISQASIQQEAIDALLSENYGKALMENKLAPIAQPAVNIEQMDDEGITVVISVPVLPEVELGQYKDLEVAKGTVEVTDEEIENALKNYQQQFAELSVKGEEAAVELNDTATIDFEGFVDGEAFEGGKGEAYPLEIGSGSFIPGFEDQLVGLKAGEEKDVVVTFPENYGAENLAGKEATFKCKIIDIKTKTLPEIDDELAKDVNIEGVETLDQLKEHVTKDLTSRKESEVDNKFNEDLFKAIIENSKVEESAAMIEQEVQQLLQEIEMNLQQQGLNFELYEQFTGQSKDKIAEDVRPQAVDRFKLNAILAQIVKAEGLENTQEELDAELQLIADTYQRELEEVKNIFANNMDRLESDLLTRKALEFVRDNLKK